MNAGNIIVSYRSVRRGLEGVAAPPGGFESASTPPQPDVRRVAESIRQELARPGAGLEPGATPEEVAEWTARLSDALTKLDAAEAHPDVLTAPQDETASLLQSYLAEKAAELQSAREAAAGGFEAKFDDRDITGWAGSLVSWIRGLRKHVWQAPPAGPEPCADSLRVAVLGDWGTGLYGAPECAKSIRKDPGGFGLLLHLGDVYYAGTEKEVQTRFLDLWPKVPNSVSRALNSNHEMYSGGHAYFNRTLKEFGQSSSCFALQNARWLLVGLDTAYAEHDLAHDQAAWLEGLAAAAGDRKLVLFSHHQPYSLLDNQEPKLVAKLGRLLAGRKVFAWYWGHEHRCVLYDTHPAWGVRGRCVGHSGYPYFRSMLKDAPRVAGDADAGWYRLSAKNLVPGGLLLDGPNPYLADHRDDYGPNGYATLEFEGEHLTEFVHDPIGAVIWQQRLA
jgi:hypothetical protein